MLTRIASTVAIALATLCYGTCTAHADPPPFPDLDKYAPVDAAEYTIALPSPGDRPIDQTFFLTPDGIPCTFLNPSIAGCTNGNLPGVPLQAGARYVRVSTDSGIKPYGSSSYVNGTIQGHPLKTLPPFHSLSVNGTICGVDDSGTTACKDPQGRGFILSPAGSAWYPHV